MIALEASSSNHLHQGLGIGHSEEWPDPNPPKHMGKRCSKVTRQFGVVEGKLRFPSILPFLKSVFIPLGAHETQVSLMSFLMIFKMFLDANKLSLGKGF